MTLLSLSPNSPLRTSFSVPASRAEIRQDTDSFLSCQTVELEFLHHSPRASSSPVHPLLSWAFLLRPPKVLALPGRGGKVRILEPVETEVSPPGSHVVLELKGSGTPQNFLVSPPRSLLTGSWERLKPSLSQVYVCSSCPWVRGESV